MMRQTDKKKSYLQGQDSPKLKKALAHKETYATEQPYNLSQRFRNLQNPLKFIENANIISHSKRYKDLQSDLKQQQQSKAQFSKSIYKKVISRDNEYNFQNDLIEKDKDIIEVFNQRSYDKGQRRKSVEKVTREKLERKFKHGEAMIEEERERQREESEKSLTFRHVKAIDTPEFDQLKDVQFYQLIKGEEEKGFGHSGSGSGSEIENLAIQTYLQTFKHSMINESQYHDKNSYNFLFDCDRELKFWRLDNIFKEEQKTKDVILSNCAYFDPSNVSMFQMFDFSIRMIQIDDVMKFYRLKEQLQAKMDMDKNNQSLQQKYNQARKRFEEMKENRLKSKNQRLPAKFLDSEAQTNDKMKEKDFQQYFVQDAKNIFSRLSQLNSIRDRIVEEQQGQTFNVMATNVGLQIGKQLFKLLMLVLKGQKFLDYSSFIRAENQHEVEKKILELIYLQFKNFSEYEVNGVSKVDIIKRYLQERQKNQRFFQTYVYKRTNVEPQNRQSPKLTRTVKK